MQRRNGGDDFSAFSVIFCKFWWFLALFGNIFAFLVIFDILLIFGIFGDFWDFRHHHIFYRKYRSQVVRNTVWSFGEIHLTKFEKYSKNRSDPDFLWRGQRRTEEDRGIGHSSKLMSCTVASWQHCNLIQISKREARGCLSMRTSCEPISAFKPP